MMKKTYIVCVLSLLALAMTAKPVSREQAGTIARQFVAKKHAGNAKKQLSPALLASQLVMEPTEKDSYYVFNVGADNGFVVVSGDDRTPAILGYSDNGHMDMDNLPDNVKAWFADYERQLAQLDRVPVAQAPKFNYATIEPMLTTKWNQAGPYWNACPVSPQKGTVCPTGCLATAMAQIMNYHRYPSATKATIPAYTTETEHIRVPAIGTTTINWDDMQDEYYTQSTDAQKNAVATLMKLCGAAVQMDYTYSGSGAADVYLLPAVVDYFGYDDGTSYLDRNFYSYDEWVDMVYTELAAGRPVLYTGMSVGGGHAFVVDGYDKDGLFYVNWGWGGLCNGAFLLSLLNPNSNVGYGASQTSDGYSFLQAMLVGMQPPATPQSATPKSLAVANFTSQKGSYSKFNGGFTTNWTMTVYHQAARTENFDYAVALFNESNKMLQVQDAASYTFSGYQGITIKNTSFRITADLADGVYYAKAVSRLKGTSEWVADVHSDPCTAKVVVAGNSMIVYNPERKLDVTLELVTENPQPKQPIELRFTVKNLGSAVNDVMYVGYGDYPLAGIHFDVDAGCTETFGISIEVPDYGTYHLEAGTADVNTEEAEILAELTIEVADLTKFTANGVSYHIKGAEQVEVIKPISSQTAYQGEVTIPDEAEYRGVSYKVTSVASKAFYNCTGLTKIALGRQLQTIGSGAFEKCDNLSQVHIADMNMWCALTFENQFANPLYSTKNYSRKLYLNGEEVSGEVYFPEGLTTTSFLGFYDCDKLTKVVLPSTIKEVDRHTFSGCSGLMRVVIPEGLETLDHSAFIRCSSLPWVELPSTLKSVAKYAFSKCTALEYVRLHNSVPPTADATSFDAETYEKTTLYVPQGAASAYQAHAVWKKFKTIVEIADGEQPVAIGQLTATPATQGRRYVDMTGRRLTKKPVSGFYFEVTPTGCRKMLAR